MASPQLQPQPIRVIGPDPSPGHGSGGLRDLWEHRQLLWDFVVRDLKHRYLGSSIGFFWTVVTPLLELVTYTFVFHGLIGVEIGPEDQPVSWASYALFLFCGMVTWLSITDGLSRCTTVVLDHAHLVKKANFPLVVLPGHIIVSAVLNQLIRLGVLLAAIFVLGGDFTWHLALVPLVVAVQAVAVTGAGLLLATAGVYFRDAVHWVNAGLMLWMFITPIFYSPQAFAQRFNLLLQLNPLSHLVGVYRSLILNGAMPHPHTWLIVGVVSVLSLLVGYSVFHHHRDRFADLI